MTAKKPKRAAELEREVRHLLDSGRDDASLREELEAICREPAFPGLIRLWGPRLYERNKLLFRPFIISHFSNFMFDPPRTWKFVKWKGRIAADLDQWLEAADKADDIRIFRLLYQWKMTPPRSWRPDANRIQTDLLNRFRAAGTPGERRLVLEKFGIWFTMDENTAVELYKIDSDSAGPFILNHLPTMGFFSQKRELWSKLYDLTETNGDEKTGLTLYRRQIPLPRWEKEVLEICAGEKDPGELDRALEARHPQSWGKDLGETFYKMLEKRGRDVMPYLVRHLFQARFGYILTKGLDKMLALAEKNEWFDFWAALLRISARPPEFNKAIERLLDDRALPEQEIIGRLVMLAGVSREWNFPGFGLAAIKPLEEKVALKLYDRFPALLRGPFKAAVGPTYNASLAKLLDKLMQSGDEDMIDFMASRNVTRYGSWMKKEQKTDIERLADYYEALKNKDNNFARRACHVLGLIPAYSIFEYNELIRVNRLARLLFERSAEFYLSDEAGLRDILEAPEIHVQALAYRALGLDDDGARQVAADNVVILMGTLLRPLHRKTRLLAFTALINAAHTPALAHRIHDKARQALDLPDIRYPKEQLVGLIGGLLHKWPELRREAEQPVIYGKAAAS